MSSAVLLESCGGEFGTGRPPDTTSACDSAQDAEIRDLPWPHVLRYEKLLSENKDLKQKLTCCTNLGTFLGESQVEVSRLQKLVENLKQENAHLKTPPRDEPPQQNRESICATTDSFVFEGNKSEEQLEPHKFEKKTSLPQSMVLQQLFDDISVDGGNLMQQMQRVEDSLSHCATHFKKSSTNTAGATFATGSTEGSQGLVQHDILTRFGILAMEFHRLASSVHKSEERTAGLQTLCERLVKENGELRERLEKGMVPQVCGKALQASHCRQASEDCRQGWHSHTDRKEDEVDPADFGFNNRPEMKGAIGFVKVMDKQMHKEHTEESLKLVCQKVKTLEKQRKELLDVNKQWDEQFRTMKIQYESKITELRARLESSKRWALDSSGNQERREREFDRALLTARDRIGRNEQERQRLESELHEARAQAELQNRKLEQMDREVRRLNKALADALARGPGAIPVANRKDQAHFPECEGREDLLTQVAVLKEQVKIYEEDFRKERADRERMNTQNEEIRLEDLKLKEKMDLTSAKLINIEETLAKEKQEKEHLQRLMKTYRPQSERRQEEERCGPLLTQGNYRQEGGWGNGFSGIEEMRYPPRDKHWDYRLRPPPPYQPNNLDDIEHG